VIAAQIACVGWAVGSSYARRRGRGHAKDETFLRRPPSRCCSAVGSARGGPRDARGRTAGVQSADGGCAHVPGLVGAIGGFTAYAYALKHLPVATVSLYAYVNPIIAVILGILILREPVRRSYGDCRRGSTCGDGAGQTGVSRVRGARCEVRGARWRGARCEVRGARCEVRVRSAGVQIYSGRRTSHAAPRTSHVVRRPVGAHKSHQEQHERR